MNFKVSQLKSLGAGEVAVDDLIYVIDSNPTDGSVKSKKVSVGDLIDSRIYGISSSQFVLITGYYADPSWILSLDWSKIINAPSFVTSLSALTDVQLSTPLSGQALVYNGTKWVNQGIGELDTLNSVTTRGNTTTNSITVGSTFVVGDWTTRATNVYVRAATGGADERGYYIGVGSANNGNGGSLTYNPTTNLLSLRSPYNSGTISLSLEGNTNSVQFHNTSGTVVSKFVSSTGNLLIGTTTDSGFKLDVNGTGRISSSLQFGTSNTSYISSPATGVLSLNSNIGSGCAVDINGQYKFYYGQLQGGGSAYFTTYLSVGTTSNLGATLNIKGAGSTSATTSLLVQNSSSTPSLTVLDNGLVSAGTASSGVLMNNNGGYPSIGFWESIARWTIQRQGSDHLDFIANAANGNAKISFVPSNTTGGVGIGNDLYQSAGVLKPASAILSLYAESQGFLQPRLSTSQKNSIVTPATGLQVYDSTLNKNNLYNGTLWQNIATETWVAGQGYLTTTPTLSQVTAAGNTTLSDITVGGINSTWDYSLSRDSGSANVRLGRFKFIRSTYNPTGVSASIDFWRGGSAYEGILAFSTNGGSIGDTSVERMRITDSGNVLINTTTDAGYKLDVNGTARINSSLYFTDPAYIGAGRIYQGANNTFIVTGGPGGGGENITFGPSNRIFINASQTRASSLFQIAGGLSVGTWNYPGTYGAQAYISGSTTANGGGGRGLYIDSTIVAAANNDVLVGLDINPTFTNGAFTGVQNVDLRTKNVNSVFGSGFGYGATYGYDNDGLIQFSTVSDTTVITMRPYSNPININNNYWAKIIQQTSSFKIIPGNYQTGYFRNSAVSGAIALGGSEAFSSIGIYIPANTSNVLINTTTDAGYKLDVAGITRVVGTDIPGVLTVGWGKSNSITIGSNTANSPIIFLGSLSLTAHPGGSSLSIDPGYIDTTNTGTNSNRPITLAPCVTGNSTGNVILLSSGARLHASRHQPTSGVLNMVMVGGAAANQYMDFAPSSGNAEFNSISIVQQLNTSGTYAGIVRGVYYNPILTSVTGITHRAIETTSGDVILNGGQVGIGTTSPTGRNGYGGGTLVEIVNNTAYASLNLNGGNISAPTYLTLGAQGSGADIRVNNKSLQFGINSIDALKIATTGNVLINTVTDAGYKLDVNGTTRLQDHLLFSSGKGIYASSALSTVLQSSVNYFTHNRLDSSGTLGFQIAVAGNVQSFWRYNDGTGDVEFGNANGSYHLGLYAGNTERVKILGNGNLGIGTTTPVSKLNVYGGDIISSSATANRTTKLNDVGLYISRTSDGTYPCSITGDGGMIYDARNNHTFRSDTVTLLDIGNAYQNVTIGASQTSGARLVVKGSGSTSATSSLLIQNSSGSNALKITDDAQTFYYGTFNVVQTHHYSHNGGGAYRTSESYNITDYTRSYGNAWTLQGGFGGVYATIKDGFYTLFKYSLNVSNSLSAPNASAILQADSTTQGFLPPRLTTAQINAITTPAEGLQVYNTDLHVICFYDGTAWRKVSHSTM